MEKKRSRLLNPWFACLVVAAVLTVSCGTILYPERNGQYRGRVDPGVVVMDGVLLFFFIIPGVIAFVVDFSTGAIYYPPGRVQLDGLDGATEPAVVRVPPQELTQERLARLIEEHTGKRIDLSDSAVELYPLESRDQIAKVFEDGGPEKLALERAQRWDCPLYRADAAELAKAESATR